MRTLVLAGVGALAASAAHATVVDYPNFNTSAGLTLAGAANITNVHGQLQLTPDAGGQAGAAYSTTAITLGTGNSFSTQFQFQFTRPGGIDPADGITFVLAANPSGLGTGGGDMGYGGVGHSLAVEFDTFDNGPSDGDSSNHVAIDEDGNIENGSPQSDQALANVYGIQSCTLGNFSRAGCMSNGDMWTAKITYDGTNLNATLFDPAEGVTFNAITNFAVDVGALLGTSNAFVGFTAGTGSGQEGHQILNWEFSNTANLPPPTLPEPASLALIGGGIAGLGFLRHRKRR